MKLFKDTHKKKYVVLVAILCVIFAALVLELTNVIDLISSSTRSNTDEDAQTTSTTATAQSDFTDGDLREPGNALQENEGTGTIADTGGTVPSGTDTTNPQVSLGGEIGVYQPRRDTLIKSGQEISGFSSTSVVNYRIIDNVSGLISAGSLKVVDGRYSGKITFTTSAEEGRIDVFATKSDGSEYGNVEIPVRFE